MITLHTWTTPNGRKISIMLEELGIPYEIKPVNIGKDEQFTPEFLAISPNNKIPAIVDDEANLSLFESGAILTYLADKYGKFLAKEGSERYKALEWLSWQVGGLGPMFGQVGFFALSAKEKSDFAIQRFVTEAERLIGVMEKQLTQHPYLAGASYTIADIATYPWVAAASTRLKDLLGKQLEAQPAIQAWLKRVGERPAVQRGMELPKVG